MATPSVLTVPSMYGDGILYSGPSAYGSELASQPVNLQVDFQAAPSGGVIVDANTFTTSGGGLEGIRSKDAAFTLTVGTAFEVEIRGTTTSNGITLGDFGGGGNEYGSGFGVHRFISGNNRLWIRQNSAGTTTITHFSIRQVTQGSDFDFTRSTTGTRINEDGYIEDVPYNFIPYSQDIDNADWDKVGTTVSANEIIAPDNSLTGDKINESAGGTYHNVNHDDKVEDGVTYTASAYFKAAERTTASIYENLGIGGPTYPLSSFNLSNGTVDSQNANHIAKISSAGSGWYRCSITFTSNGTRTGSLYYAPNNQLNYTGVLNSGVFMWGAQFVKGDKVKDYLPTTDRVNLARLNYPLYGGCPSILAEPQRTNLVIKSNDISNGGGNALSNLQINSSNNLSPEGINNAQEIEVTSASQPKVESVAVSNATLYAVSGYVKKVTGDFFGLGFYQADIGNQYAKFNLNTGTFVGISGSSTNIYNCEIIAYKNNWYRITCNILTGSDPSKSNFKWMAMSESAFNSGVVGDKFLIYGRQAEQAGYVTSLIHTKGSTVTRNEDKAINSGLGTTDTFNDSEGVLFIETKALVNNAVARSISINAGNGQNRVVISYPNTASSRVVGFIQSTAGGGLNGNVDGIDITQKHKIAVKYKLNNCAVFVDGIKRIQANTVAMPVGLDRMHFSNGVNANSAEYRGDLNAIAVYKTALTDTELANLTSYNNHDLFIPYRSRMQMIGADQELQCTEHDITRFL